MSIHSSLRSAGKAGGALRNVLKRHERIRHLMDKGLWPEGGRSVFGLPKIKQIKMKARKAAKEKDETAAGETPAAGAAPAGPPAK
jgi:small basic protein (TIGR04137 family)